MAQRRRWYLLLFLLFLFWLPFLIVSAVLQPRIFSTLESLPKADAALIFGAHLTDKKELTPLLFERVEAGRILLEKGYVESLIVSNTPVAAEVMRLYLQEQGVGLQFIEIDHQAAFTTDSCHAEKKKFPQGRTVIFLSQGFHLPRLLYQCRQAGVSGIGFQVEALGLVDRSKSSIFTRLTTRGRRYTREAALIWLAVLGIYR